jgi:hypothetical protein
MSLWDPRNVAYFEGFAQLADLSDEERAEWFIKNDNFFLE